MQIRITESSPRYLAGMTIGALVLTCFATIWASQALQGLNEWGSWSVVVITCIGTVALLALGITTLRAARRLHQEKETPEEEARGKEISRRFGIIDGVQFTAIVAAVVLLRLAQHSEFISPAICLIVGLHFLPLASLFQVRVYFLAGVVLSLLGGGALLALLFGLTPGGLYTWSVIVGLSTTVILWLTSLFLLVGVRRVLHLNK